ncbi:amidohydrolase family protein [Stakelama tenebrarum]|uniref:Amidohydrolase family protein n=1 Tax=Stakelama tenebrarum TaxID=2711215 RepID=A0A6G6Y1S1_9SPHN|nr:amidohydrolase family protein [Sphingosinithalassobacter tenebrarum]QIG78668.1 amidohydrolase family protein [Sphingosinithalassobacter tenebrarum]
MVTLLKRIALALAASNLVGSMALCAQEAPDPAALLIAHVNVLDLSGDAPVIAHDQDILVSRGRIVAVDESGSIALPDGARRIDGEHRLAMPGLVDMHVHVWDTPELAGYLGHGVTMVRNMSGMPYLLALRDAVAAGEIDGPRIVTTGPILNGSGPNAQPNHQIVDTARAARAAVQWQYDQGFRRLKVYSNLSAEAYAAIREEAARLGMTITGHPPEGVREPGIPFDRPFNIPFETLLDDGFVTLEHAESIVWHGLRGGRDMDAARALAARIAESGVAVDPTLFAFYGLMRTAETRGAWLERPGTETLNPFITMMEGENFARWRGESAEAARADFEFYRRFTGMLHDAGVPLIAGTDSGIFANIPGRSLIDELHLLVSAGLSPYAALQAATVNPVRILGESDEAGRIAPGYRADFLLLDGDPLADVGAAGTPWALVRGGRWLDGEALAGLRDAATRVDAERSQAQVMEAIGQQQAFE